jgi:hypothetical protein
MGTPFWWLKKLMGAGSFLFSGSLTGPPDPGLKKIVLRKKFSLGISWSGSVFA